MSYYAALLARIEEVQDEIDVFPSHERLGELARLRAELEGLDQYYDSLDQSRPRKRRQKRQLAVSIDEVGTFTPKLIDEIKNTAVSTWWVGDREVSIHRMPDDISWEIVNEDHVHLRSLCNKGPRYLYRGQIYLAKSDAGRLLLIQVTHGFNHYGFRIGRFKWLRIRVPASAGEGAA